mmetsp:Transcript_46653/g.117335  ORF Transcript_46653/g.117335 Transcript_46653/m.117335 type:complete len:249 (+) Transcript_46653:1078-1824(+)
MLGPVVATHDKHPVLVCNCRRSIPSLRDRTLHRHNGPLALRKIVPVEVAPVVAVVAGKDVHGAVELHPAVAVPWRRWVAQGGVNDRPDLVLRVVLPEVVDAVVPIVACEDVDPVAVRHNDVTVSRRRRRTRHRDLRPLGSLEAELVEVVDAVAAVVPREDVQAIANYDPRVQRALAWWDSGVLHQGPLVDGGLALAIVHLHLRVSIAYGWALHPPASFAVWRRPGDGSRHPPSSRDLHTRNPQGGPST